MEQNIGERIIKLRKEIGLKQAEFGEKLGLTNSAISMIELSKSPVTEANIRLICFTFGVKEEWLRDGIGEMFDAEALLSEKEKRLLALFRQLSPKAQEMLIEYAEKLLSDEAALKGNDSVKAI